MCSDTRQEFILLSDILGISMLVDAVAHQSGEDVTDSTVVGSLLYRPASASEQG